MSRVLPVFCAASLLCILCACLPASALAQPAPPDPRFGIVEAFENAPAAGEAGAGYTRILLRWDVIQPAGPADWKPANVPDPFVATELAAGRQVVGLLIGTPAWAADPSKGAGAADGARAVPRMDAWAAFCRRMAQHYRGRIKHWIIWNEPDVWEAGHPGNTWAASEQDYAQLLKTAYLAIKDVNPELQVHVAGLTYFWDWSHGRRQYLDRLLAAITADAEAAAHNYYFDAIVFHLYFKPLQAPQVLGEARQLLQKYGMADKAIWINETNAPPSDDPQEPPWSQPRYHISQSEQAAFILQELTMAFAAGAARVEVYKMRNSAGHPESIEPYGLLRADNSPRPAFTAYRVATTYLRDFQTARLERQGDAYAVTFERGPHTTTVLWTMGRAPAQVAVRAIAAQASLVDEQGQARPVTAIEGRYLLTLPGAACTNGGDCFIGGAPRLLVEDGAASGRPALLGAGPAAAVPAAAAPTSALSSVAAGGAAPTRAHSPVATNVAPTGAVSSVAPPSSRPERVPEGPGLALVTPSTTRLPLAPPRAGERARGFGAPAQPTIASIAHTLPGAQTASSATAAPPATAAPAAVAVSTTFEAATQPGGSVSMGVSDRSAGPTPRGATSIPATPVHTSPLPRSPALFFRIGAMLALLVVALVVAYSRRSRWLTRN